MNPWVGESREFFERFKFNQRNQESGESIEEYVTVLHMMSKTCGFCDCMKDKLLVDRVLLGVRDDRMRELLILRSDLDLTTAIDVCKAVEATSVQMKALNQKNGDIHKVGQRHFPKSGKKRIARRNQTGKIYRKQNSSGKDAAHLSLEVVRSIVPEDIAEIIPDKYPDVFSSSSIGTLPGSPVHLTVTDDALPTVCLARIIPESLKGKVKDALDDLQAKDIIEEVSSPTDWVNQIAVLQKKSGKVCVCLDPRPLNIVLKREHYPLPVLDDILPQLSDATVFSICDLKDGYLHCKLDEESSLLTTFATPWGRYRWKRLPFGLKVSSEIFQKRLYQALDGLSGVRCVADDIIIWGNSDAEHDARLHCLLNRCQAVGIVLN
ncbi:uncharacterized protein K02A2.6-like [Lytechinus pictus]|uniref:uncharacterized protein K02A2.6-like n=1 Tax=Lytechinus pictus TaxID=7653 RepID=UPI0030B9B9A0